jgi:hypothetical protein
VRHGGEDGTPVATADLVGRKRWTVEAGNHRYEFQRASIWRREQELRPGGERVGSVRRPSLWRTDVVADLPGLPLPVQIFALAVILTGWAGPTPRHAPEGPWAPEREMPGNPDGASVLLGGIARGWGICRRATRRNHLVACRRRALPVVG